MEPTFDRTLTRGPLYAALWKIAWPTILLNIVGALQGLVDHVTVGWLVGYHANAAVGVGWQIFAFFVVFINALYGGVGVLIARFAGADEPEKVHNTFTQALCFSLLLSVGVFAPLGYLLAPRMLEMIHATPEVRAEALPYLRILFLLNAGLMLFFLLASALRAAGDAQTPMRLTLLMTASNVVLTVTLVGGWGPIPALGTRGAAFSSVAAGALVTLSAFYRLIRGRLIVRCRGTGGWGLRWKVLREILRFGLPMGLQSIALHFGGLVVMRYVGSLDRSAEAQAAYAVAHSQVFVWINLVSIGLMLAASTVAGQNLGAGDTKRTAHTPLAATLIGLAVNIPLALVFFVAPGALLGIFGLEDPVIVELGTRLLRYLSLSSAFLTAAYVYTGALQGMGDTKGALGITLISQLAVPLGICGVLDATSGLTPSGIWLAIALGPLVRCVLSVLRFRQGRWKEIHIDIDAPEVERRGVS